MHVSLKGTLTSVTVRYETVSVLMIDFCNTFGFQPVPAGTDVICESIAYSAQTVCPTSIKQYLSVIRILHVESGYDDPHQDGFAIKLLLKGVQRTKGNFVKRKLSITL